MPGDKKSQYMDLLGGLKGVIIGFMVFIGAGIAINYYVHLEENPLTGRKRFMSLTADQINKIAEIEDAEVSQRSARSRNAMT